jgi:GNAT superfamily N-acetyltransferase
MPQFTFDPPISKAPGLIQTIRMTEGDQFMGTAIWHAPLDSDDGVVQLLELNVAESLRRQGLGKRLLAAVVNQTLAYHQLRQITPRRLWVALRQKRHIIPRAFFASQGFTHISTIKHLLQNEDALVYIRTFD